MIAVETDSPSAAVVMRMRTMSIRALSRLYLRNEKVYSHCVRRIAGRDHIEGVSVRYTLITLLGLCGETPAAAREALCGDDPRDICEKRIDAAAAEKNLGNIALTLWAAREMDHPRWRSVFPILRDRFVAEPHAATVEAAWALSAVCPGCDDGDVVQFRELVADRLLAIHREESGLFPHALRPGVHPFRAHVCCFADLVYPIQALSRHYRASGRRESLDAANRCAKRICDVMGDAGQWWWHYDCRNGRVIEGYPVYAVHQDAMAPMALLSLRDAGGLDCTKAIETGLAWLERAPELGGGSLIDEKSGWIWRKVARREPFKLVRRLQAGLSGVCPPARLPGVNTLFPSGVIDFESRAYHYGWLLYAFPKYYESAEAWPGGGAA